jgi:hypothetical protein
MVCQTALNNGRVDDHHAGGEQPGAIPKPEDPLSIRPLSSFRAKPVQWTWRNYIPRGYVTFLEGDPGECKSTILYDVAARITRGRPMPDGSDNCLNGQPGKVLIFNAEDGPEDVIRPRLLAAGADPERVLLGEGVPALPEDIQALEAKVRESGAVLVILDPVEAYLSDKVDSHNNHKVRRALAPLAAVAMRLGVAIVGVRHLTKNKGGRELHRGNGSVAFPAVVRAAFQVGNGKFTCVKMSAGEKPATLHYRPVTTAIHDVDEAGHRVEIQTSVVQWSRVPFGSKNGPAVKAPARVEAVDAQAAQAEGYATRILQALDAVLAETGKDRASRTVVKDRVRPGINASNMKRGLLALVRQNKVVEEVVAGKKGRPCTYLRRLPGPASGGDGTRDQGPGTT